LDAADQLDDALRPVPADRVAAAGLGVPAAPLEADVAVELVRRGRWDPEEPEHPLVRTGLGEGGLPDPVISRGRHRYCTSKAASWLRADCFSAADMMLSWRSS